MLRARIDAEVSLKKYVLENVLAPAGFPADKIGAIDIIFDTQKFEAFKSGVRNGGER